jgi:hypothetical protein
MNSNRNVHRSGVEAECDKKLHASIMRKAFRHPNARGETMKRFYQPRD